MKNRFLITLVSLIFFLSGCVTLGNKSKDKLKKPPQIYKVDLNNDLMEEIIEVKDGSDTGVDTTIVITKQDKSKIDSLTVYGKFTKVEFIDLNEDGYKQIALFYEGKDNSSKLTIYNLKNNKLTKIFTIENKCGIDTDFSSVLARIKVGKSKAGQSDCSANYPEDWEIWVWSGDKFIKEK